MSRADEVAERIGGLTDPSADDVWRATHEFASREVAAAAATLGTGGGGGSLPFGEEMSQYVGEDGGVAWEADGNVPVFAFRYSGDSHDRLTVWENSIYFGDGSASPNQAIQYTAATNGGGKALTFGSSSFQFRDDGALGFPTGNNLYFAGDPSGPPSDSLGIDGNWALGEDGHIYYKTGGVWVDQVGPGGGESLPAWWTIDDTTDEESVQFAGAVLVTPTANEPLSPLRVIPFEYVGGEDGALQVDQQGGVLMNGSLFSDASLLVGALAEQTIPSLLVRDADSNVLLQLGPNKPVVPLTTPGVQDVIDALVALGLVSQSD